MKQHMYGERNGIHTERKELNASSEGKERVLEEKVVVKDTRCGGKKRTSTEKKNTIAGEVGDSAGDRRGNGIDVGERK